MLNDRYPFMSLLVVAGTEYIGIIQNQDDSVTTIYDFGVLATLEAKQTFIDLANNWWWESNHSVPINIFLKSDWDQFKHCRKTFSNRELQILHGPICSLQQITTKKTKRRSITLVRRI